MYQVHEDKWNGFQDASQRLWFTLQQSPMWPLLKDDPMIKAFLNALRELEADVKQGQSDPTLFGDLPDATKK